MPSLVETLTIKTQELGGKVAYEFQQHDFKQLIEQYYRSLGVDIVTPRGFCWALSHFYLNCMGDYQAFHEMLHRNQPIRDLMLYDQAYQGFRTGVTTGQGASAEVLATHPKGWQEPISQKLLANNYTQTSQFVMSPIHEDIELKVLFVVCGAHVLSMSHPTESGHTVSLYESIQDIRVFDPNAGVFIFSKYNGRRQAINKASQLTRTLINWYQLECGFDEYHLNSFIPLGMRLKNNPAIYYGKFSSRLLQITYLEEQARRQGITYIRNRSMRAVSPAPEAIQKTYDYDIFSEADFIPFEWSELWVHVLLCFGFIRCSIRSEEITSHSRWEIWSEFGSQAIKHEFLGIHYKHGGDKTEDILAEYLWHINRRYPEDFYSPAVYVAVDNWYQLINLIQLNHTKYNILSARFDGGLCICFVLLVTDSHYYLYNSNWELFVFDDGFILSNVIDFFQKICLECFAGTVRKKDVTYSLACLHSPPALPAKPPKAATDKPPPIPPKKRQRKASPPQN